MEKVAEERWLEVMENNYRKVPKHFWIIERSKMAMGGNMDSNNKDENTSESAQIGTETLISDRHIRS